MVRSGQILFYNRCVQCHNPGGYGYGTVGQYLVPHPPDLAAPLVQHITDGAMFWHITMGQGKMPGFRHWLTPDERWALTAYVRSLKGSTDIADRDNAGGMDRDARRALPALWRDRLSGRAQRLSVQGAEPADGRPGQPRDGAQPGLRAAAPAAEPLKSKKTPRADWRGAFSSLPA